MKLFVIAVLIVVAAAGRLEHLERSYLPPHGSDGGFGSPSSHGSFGVSSGAFGAAGTGLHGHNAGGNFAGATSNQYLPPDHGPSSNGARQFAGSLQGFGSQQNFHSQQYSGHQAAPAQQYAVSSSLFGSPQAGSTFGASSHQHYPQQYSGHQTAPAQQYAVSSSQFGSLQAGSSFGASSHQHYPQQYSGHQAAPGQQFAVPSSQFGSLQAGSSFGASSHQHYPQQSAAASRQYLAPNTGSYQQPPQQAFDEQTGYHY